MRGNSVLSLSRTSSSDALNREERSHLTVGYRGGGNARSLLPPFSVSFRSRGDLVVVLPAQSSISIPAIVVSLATPVMTIPDEISSLEVHARA